MRRPPIAIAYSTATIATARPTPLLTQLLTSRAAPRLPSATLSIDHWKAARAPYASPFPIGLVCIWRATPQRRESDRRTRNGDPCLVEVIARGAPQVAKQ